MRLIKYALLAAALYYVGRALASRITELDWREIRFHPGYLLAAGVSIFLARVMTAATVRSLIRSFFQPPPWRVAAGAAWIPQLGKYIPGKAASVIGAVWILRSNGIPGLLGAGVVFLLSGLSSVVGLVVAAPTTLWPEVRHRVPYAPLTSALLLLAGVILLQPRVIETAGNFILKRLKRPPLPHVPPLSHYVKPVGILFLQWTLSGLSLWLLARSITPVSPQHIPLFISTSALGVTLGFLAFFAPAGVGVREAIFLAVLEPITGPGPTALLVVAMRLLQTLMDLIMAGLGMLVLHQSAPPTQWTTTAMDDSPTPDAQRGGRGGGVCRSKRI